MTRQAFIARLREGLRGLPPQTVADIVADYESHFVDGEADGRTEAEVAAALGDPDRLARELRAESSLNRWREERSPSSAAAAVFAVLGLGAIDILILLPIVFPVFGAVLAVLVSALASTMSALNATTYSSSRVSFAMGRDYNLPKIFARIHPIRHTPSWAVVISGLLIGAMAWALPIEDVAAAADLMFLFLFMQVNLSLIRLRRQRPDLDRRGPR